MTKIDRKFSSLVVDVVKFLTLENVTVQKVKDFVSDLVAERFTEQVVELSAMFSNIEEISTLRDLILYLNKYWSFFNFTLLEKLIKKFKINDAEIKQYISNLQEVSIQELPVLVHHPQSIEGFTKETLSVTMIPGFFDLSCEELLLFHQRLTDTLRIERFALLLRQINQTENKLEFTVAETANIDVYKLNSLDLHSLEECYVSAVEFQGTKQSQTYESTLKDEENDDEGIYLYIKSDLKIANDF